jgi:hypothetical protein
MYDLKFKAKFKFGIAGLLFYFILPPGLLFSGDVRNRPLDMYLIIDGSAHLEGVKDTALGWISRELVDSILQEGDRLTVWSAGDRARIAFEEILGASGKAGIKEKLKTLDTGAASPDFPGALRDAAQLRARRSETDRISYTLLISGTAGGLGASLSGPSLNLIRYSRVEEFKGWRTLVVAPEIEGKVKQAAAAFAAGR